MRPSFTSLSLPLRLRFPARPLVLRCMPPVALVTLAAVLIAPAMRAQTTIILNGSDSANYTTTAANPLTLSAGSGTHFYAGVIDGNGGITKTGAGTLVFTNVNFYQGSTTISAGTLRLADGDNRLPVGTTLFLNNGSTLDLGGNGSLLGGIGSASNRAVGNITAGTLTNFNGTFLQSGTFANTFEGSGGARIWIGGDTGATVTLNGTNNMTYGDAQQFIIGHTTTGAAGTVKIGTADSLLAVSQTAQVFSGTLDLNGQSNVRGTGIQLLGGTASNLVNNHASASASFAGTVTLTPGAASNLGGSGNLTLSGVISGVGSGLTKTGAGALTLTGANTYTGNTTISAGTLGLGHNSALGSTTATLTINGGGIRAVNAERTIANPVVLGGSFELGRLTNFSGPLTLTNNITITSANPDTGDASTSTFSGAIGGSFGLTFAQGANPIGTIALTGTNTYTGGTTFNGGRVSIANASALGTGGLTFGGGTLVATGAGMSLTKNTVLNAGGGTFEIGQDYFTLAGNISGTGTLTKTGANLLTLAGAHTYTGATTISAGTLKFAANGGTASALATPSLAIASGAKVIFADTQTYAGTTSGAGVLEHEFGGVTTLTGAAAHTGGTNIIGGTIQVGNGGTTGSLAGNVALSSGGTLGFNRSDALTFSGAISGTGNVTKSGAGTLTLGGTNSFSGSLTISGGTVTLSSGSALADSATVSLANTAGATLALAADKTIGSLSGGGSTGGNVALDSSTLVVGGTNTSTTFSGAISGSGALVKIGAGTLTLAGGNTYTGSTSVNAGTLQIGDGGTASIATSGFSVQSGTTLVFNHSNDLSYANGTTGGGSFVKAGTGTLNLSYFSDFDDYTLLGGMVGVGHYAALGVASNSSLPGGGRPTITINGGGLKAVGGNQTVGNPITLDGNFSLGRELTLSGPVTLVRDSTITSTNNDQSAPGSSNFTGDITGAYNLTFAGGANPGTTILTGYKSYTGVTTISGGTLQIGDVGLVGGLASSSIVNHAALAYYGYVNDIVSAPISGTGSLAVVGGVLHLAGNNTYTGATIVSRGTLNLLGGSAIADTSPVTFANNPSGAKMIVSAAETVGSIAGGGSAGGRILLDQRLTVGGDNTSTEFAGVMEGASGLTKVGSGTLTLVNANTFDGALTINAGTVQLSGGTALKDTTSVILANTAGATLSVASSETIGPLSGGGTTGGSVALGSGATLTTYVGENSTTFSGVISGAGSLEKAGDGTFILTATHTYTGNTSVTGGTLQIGTGGTVGSLASASLVNQATVTFNRSDAVTFSGAISGGGTLVKEAANILTLSGNNTFSGTTLINAGTLRATGGTAIGDGSTVTLANTAGVTLDIAASETIGSLSGGGATGGTVLLGSGTTLTVGASGASNTFAGTLTGSGSLTKTGSGTLTLSGSNTFSGPVTINGGVLLLTGGNALSDSSAVTLANTSGTGLFITTSETIGSLSGGGTTGGSIFLGEAVTLTTGGNNTSTTFATNIGGYGGLTKTGSGTLTLTGRNDNNGATTVTGGTLRLSGGAALSDIGAVSLVNTAGVTLDVIASESIGSLTGGGATGGNVTLGSGAILTVGGNHASTTFAGGISGAGGFTKFGVGTLTLTGAVTYTGDTIVEGGTLQIGAGGSASSVTLSGNITNRAALVFNRSDAVAYNGAISGSGTLKHSGSGTLTLSGANTFTGNTTIEAGTLHLASASALPASAVVSLNNTAGATLSLGLDQTLGSISGGGTSGGNVSLGAYTLTTGGNGASATFAGAIAGTGGLTKTGGGNFILSGTNTYSGPTTVIGGILEVSGGAALADTSAVTLANTNGVALQLNSSESVGSLSGGGTTGGSVLLGSRTLTTGGDNTSTTYSGAISGTGGSLVKTGTGTLTLSGTNTYTGPTTINGGMLSISANTNLGATSGGITLSGGTLRATSSFTASRTTTLGKGGGFFDVVSGSTLTWSGNITGDAGNSLTKIGTGTLLLGGTNTYFGDTLVSFGTLKLGSASAFSPNSKLTVAAGATFDANGFVPTFAGLDMAPTGTDTFGGVVTGSGGLTMSGSGTLTLSNANSYTGATTISSGTLQLGAAGALPSGTPLSLSGSGAKLALNNFAATLGKLEGVAGTTVALGAANLTVAQSANSTFAGTITGTGGLTKSGSGTLTLTGASTSSGGTTFAGGRLSIASASALGPGNLTFDGGTLTATAAQSLARDTVLSAGGGTFENDSGFLMIAGNISGPGGLTKTGSRILTLAGAHTYTGATTVSAGTLKFAANGATASALATSNLDIASGAKVIFADSQTYAGSVTGAGVLEHEFSGTTILTGAASHTGGTNIIAGTIQVGNGGASGSLAGNVALSSGGTLAFNRSDASTFAGVISGTGSVTKAGAGTLTLTGANTFSGGTTVSAGTLAAGHAAAFGTGVVRIDAGTLDLGGYAIANALDVRGGTLAGTGSVGATTVATGATVAPGNSPGTLTFTNGLTLAAGSFLDFQLGATSDLIRVTGGTLTGPTGGSITLNLSDAGDFDFVHGGTTTLFDFSGATLSGFDVADFTFGSFLAGTSAAQFSLAVNGSALALTYAPASSAVPEPSTWAALAGAIALGAALRRRRATR